jgi:hypothetical protein
MTEEFIKLKEKIHKAEISLSKDKTKLKKICRHENIHYSAGYTEYQGYDRDYINGYCECEDCGLYASESDTKLFNQLRNLYYK